MSKKLMSAALAFVLAIIAACTSITCAFAASGSELTVKTVSNLFESSSATLSENQNQVRVTFELCLTEKLVNADCEVIYDPAVLSPVEEDAEIALPALDGTIINYCESSGNRAYSDKYGEDDSRRVVVFNTTSVGMFDFSIQKVFVTILFNVVGASASSTEVELWVKYLGVDNSSNSDVSSAQKYPVDENGKVSQTLCSSIVKSAVSSVKALPASDNETDPTTYPSSGYEYGDVNRDGIVNISDATLIQKALAQIVDELDDEQKMLADVTGEGIVSISDVTDIQKRLAQIITKFKVQE